MTPSCSHRFLCAGRPLMPTYTNFTTKMKCCPLLQMCTGLMHTGGIAKKDGFCIWQAFSAGVPASSLAEERQRCGTAELWKHWCDHRHPSSNSTAYKGIKTLVKVDLKHMRPLLEDIDLACNSKLLVFLHQHASNFRRIFVFVSSVEPHVEPPHPSTRWITLLGEWRMVLVKECHVKLLDKFQGITVLRTFN